jgi:hypothetical protein
MDFLGRSKMKMGVFGKTMQARRVGIPRGGTAKGAFADTREKLGRHNGLVPHNGHQSAADFQEIEQVLWHCRHRPAEQDDIKTVSVVQSLRAIGLAHFYIVDAEFVKSRGCAIGQFANAFQA